jgi:hypothetical protein
MKKTTNKIKVDKKLAIFDKEDMKKVSKSKKKDNENKFIDVLEVIDNPDGSATITFEMDDKTYGVFVREGIRILMPKKYKDKIMVCDPDFYQSKVPVKTVELPEAELNAYVEIAFIDALKNGIKYLEEKEKNTPGYDPNRWDGIL